ncbi:MAG TPA: DinB family protein [Herpetosiphonaceae bacterium]
MNAAIDRRSLQVIYGYNAHANDLLLDTAAQLSAEQYDEVVSPNYTSIRKLVQHIFLTEGYFLAKCQQRPFEPIVPATIAELRAAWHALHQERDAYLATSGDDELGRVLTVQMRDQMFQFSPWQLLMQAVMHAAHHRGELAIMLGALGHPLANMDIIVYFSEQAGQPWPW